MTDRIEIIEWFGDHEDSAKYVAFGHVETSDFVKALAQYFVSIGRFSAEQAAEEADCVISRGYVIKAPHRYRDDWYVSCTSDTVGALAITETGWME